mmetsp:Transcript_20073/g.70991  ORF Transcript_20073/g.70991 Transcript_20073/m.70991 type:complete len:329 (-) Transcript_20073:2487-3473(-)
MPTYALMPATRAASPPAASASTASPPKRMTGRASTTRSMAPLTSSSCSPSTSACAGRTAGWSGTRRRPSASSSWFAREAMAPTRAAAASASDGAASSGAAAAAAAGAALPPFPPFAALPPPSFFSPLPLPPLPPLPPFLPPAPPPPAPPPAPPAAVGTGSVDAFIGTCRAASSAALRRSSAVISRTSKYTSTTSPTFKPLVLRRRCTRADTSRAAPIARSSSSSTVFTITVMRPSSVDSASYLVVSPLNDRRTCTCERSSAWPATVTLPLAMNARMSSSVIASTPVLTALNSLRSVLPSSLSAAADSEHHRASSVDVVSDSALSSSST